MDYNQIFASNGQLRRNRIKNYSEYVLFKIDLAVKYIILFRDNPE